MAVNKKLLLELGIDTGDAEKDLKAVENKLAELDSLYSKLLANKSILYAKSENIDELNSALKIYKELNSVIEQQLKLRRAIGDEEEAKFLETRLEIRSSSVKNIEEKIKSLLPSEPIEVSIEIPKEEIKQEVRQVEDLLSTEPIEVSIKPVSPSKINLEDLNKQSEEATRRLAQIEKEAQELKETIDSLFSSYDELTVTTGTGSEDELNRLKNILSISETIVDLDKSQEQYITPIVEQKRIIQELEESIQQTNTSNLDTTEEELRNQKAQVQQARQSLEALRQELPLEKEKRSSKFDQFNIARQEAIVKNDTRLASKNELLISKEKLILLKQSTLAEKRSLEIQLQKQKVLVDEAKERLRQLKYQRQLAVQQDNEIKVKSVDLQIRGVGDELNELLKTQSKLKSEVAQSSIAYRQLVSDLQDVNDTLANSSFSFSKQVTGGFTAISQSLLEASRELKIFGGLIPLPPVVAFTNGVNRLATSGRRAIYFVSSMSRGLDSLSLASLRTGKNLAQLSIAFIDRLKNSVANLLSIGDPNNLADATEEVKENVSGLNRAWQSFSKVFFESEDGEENPLESLRKSLKSLTEGDLIPKLKTELGNLLNSSKTFFSTLDFKNIKFNKDFFKINLDNLDTPINKNWVTESLENIRDFSKQAREFIKYAFSPEGLTNLGNKIKEILNIKSFSQISNAISNIISPEALDNYAKALKKLTTIRPNESLKVILGGFKEFNSGFSVLVDNVKTLVNRFKNLFSAENLTNVGAQLKKALKIESFAELSKKFTDSLSPKAIDSYISRLKDFTNSLKSPEGPMKVLIGGLKELGSGFSGLGSNILSLLGRFTPLIAGLGAITTAIGGLVYAFRNLEQVDIFKSFENIIGSSESSEAFLQKMQEASKGTVASIDIVRQTNYALTGVSEELESKFLQALPKYLEIAVAQSKATGKSVEYLFTSLVEGTKRSDQEIIDNLGIVIKLGDANAELAESLGKTVEELTAEEKQLALINYLLKTGDDIIKNVGSSTLSTTQVISSMTVAWKNLGTETTKSFEPFIGSIARLLAPLNNLLIAILRPIVLTIGELLRGIGVIVDAITIALTPVINVLISALDVVTRFLRGVATTLVDLLGPAFTELGYRIAVALREIELVLDIVIYTVSRLQDIVSIIGDFLSINPPNKELVDSLQDTLNSLDELEIKINTFIDNTLVGLGNWLGMATAIFRVFAREATNIIADMTNAIGAMLIGQSPPPEGALSELDTGARNAFRSWLENFTGQSLSPLSYLTSDISSILGSIGKNLTNFTFFDYLFQGVEDRLKSLTDQYNNFKQLVDNSFELLNNKQNELIKYLNQGDQSVLSSIRAIDLQKESANELLNIRREQFLLAENELLVLKGQASYLASMNNLQENGVISDTRSYEGTGSSDRAREDSSTGRQPSENIETSRGGASGGSATEKGETPFERANRLRYKRIANKFITGIFDNINTTYQEIFKPSSSPFGDPTDLATESFKNRFSASFQEGYNSIIGQAGASLYSQDPADKKFMRGMGGLEDLVKKIGEAFRDWTRELLQTLDKLEEVITSADTLAVKVEKILTLFEDIANVDIHNPFEGWKLPELDFSLPDWLGLGITPPTEAPDNITPQTSSFNTNLNNSVTKRASPVTPRVSGQYQPLNIFESLLNSLETLIVELPVKLATINTLFTTLFEVPMQALITRLFNSTYQTSLPYAVHKSMLITIPAILDSFIINKWIIFKENLIKSFEDFESLLSKVLLRPIVNILNSILSSFNKTMRTFAEGINQFILFYNKLPISIRGGDKLEFFKLDDLVFNPIEVPQFAKGGLGSGLISVGERGQEYVMGAGGSRTAVFPNSYVKATNNLAYQLSMVNSTIRGNYNRGMTTNTSNVDRSIQANIYTNNVDLISLQQYRAIR